jgi:hypothetical protein
MSNDFHWNSIRSAPLEEDVTLRVTERSWRPVQPPEPVQAHRSRLGKFGQGNAAGGDTAAVEAVLPPSASRSMNRPR